VKEDLCCRKYFIFYEIRSHESNFLGGFWALLRREKGGKSGRRGKIRIRL